MTHHIRQLHLHLELNGTETEGLALRNELAGLCYDRLLPALGRALDGCAPPDRHLCLDRLEVEAGTFALDRLEHDAAAAVAQAVAQALREQTTHLNSPFQGAALTFSQLKTPQQTVEEALFYFLVTGQLPWSFRLPPGRSLEQALRQAWTKALGSAQSETPDSAYSEIIGPATIPRHFGDALRRALTTAPARQRLVWQFSAAFREELLAACWPAAHRQFAAIRAALAPLAQPAGFEQALWETLLEHLVSGDSVPTAVLVGQTWQRLPVALRKPALGAGLEWQWPGSTQALPSSSNPIATKLPTDTTAANPNNTALVGAAGPPSPLLPASGAPPATTTAPLDSAAPLGFPKEGYYLDNAGLVLLHPFLPRFFEGLGLAQHEQLVEPARALGLLHFLATGQLLAPEHALTLPKLLCAVPLVQPVVADVELTIVETDEAEALLRAVVHHWTALRSTSPDGLRGTFLARPGKLSRRPDGDWLLQVEPLSYDILLDQLPWGISRVQLPWMPALLRVEWG
jgi:hypothetical protein